MVKILSTCYWKGSLSEWRLTSDGIKKMLVLRFYMELKEQLDRKQIRGILFTSPEQSLAGIINSVFRNQM